MRRDILKVIDANVNRAKEGLRVCEDIARFGTKNTEPAKSLKKARHAVTDAIRKSKKIDMRDIVLARKTSDDKTKFFDLEKENGIDRADIFMANMSRAKESVRVLEECSKIIDPAVSRSFRKLRFRIYDIEKGIIKKERALSGNRLGKRKR